jgi:tRNA-dihydrouridine synthase
MKEIIQATKEGAVELSVSVKTRLGYKKIAPDWIGFLLEQDLNALTIHGRTAAELSKVPANWDEIGKAVTLKKQMKKKTIIIGNGDVVDYADAVAKCKEFGVDGAMIGRGIFHNLWAFDSHGVSHMNDHKELIRILKMHMQLFEKTWGRTKNFSVLKKFFKIYINDFPNASEIRVQLMETNSVEEVEELLRTIQ